MSTDAMKTARDLLEAYLENHIHPLPFWERLLDAVKDLDAAIKAAEAGSLLREPNALPTLCYCPPDKCLAPVVMGRQAPCLRAPAHPSPEPASEPQGDAVDIVFDGPPGPEAGRFVEVENAQGQSIRFGEWVQRPDGYWALRFARALLHAFPPDVRSAPEGFVMAPREPTIDMYCAGDEAIVMAIQPDTILDGITPAQKCYAAMLAAAPKEGA